MGKKEDPNLRTERNQYQRSGKGKVAEELKKERERTKHCLVKTPNA
jgi:hypothetical protein